MTCSYSCEKAQRNSLLTTQSSLEQGPQLWSRSTGPLPGLVRLLIYETPLVSSILKSS